MPGREFSSSSLYRFGFNGQEKSTEIDGSGNSYTAEYWQYDSRLGRRWNIDPKPNIAISPYICFSGNPIWFCDPLGDTSIHRPDGKLEDIGDLKHETFDGRAVAIGKGNDALIIQPMKGSLKSLTFTGPRVANGRIRFIAMFDKKSGKFVGYAWDKKLSYSLEDFYEDARNGLAKEFEHQGDPIWDPDLERDEAGKRVLGITVSLAIPNPLFKRVTTTANAAPQGFEVQGQLTKIWSERKLFVNWLKSKHSVGGTVLNATEAQQVIDNARKLGITRIDLNRAGLMGKEITGNTAGLPHFKIENVHIVIKKGLEDILK